MFCVENLFLAKLQVNVMINNTFVSIMSQRKTSRIYGPTKINYLVYFSSLSDNSLLTRNISFIIVLMYMFIMHEHLSPELKIVRGPDRRLF